MGEFRAEIAACPCWVNTHALGHEGHCCFFHGNRKVGGGFKDDEAICHVREGIEAIGTPHGQGGE